jgi:putative transposase
MIDYVHQNPVRRRLVGRACEWKWSSAGWYEGQGRNDLPPDLVPPGLLDAP